MSMAIFSPKLPFSSSSHSYAKTHLSFKAYLPIGAPKKLQFHLFASSDNGSGVAAEDTPLTSSEEPVVVTNGSPTPTPSPPTAAAAADPVVVETVNSFKDARWVGGTWDLKQFGKDGQTNWDAVIDAEVKRRKWMQDNPQSSSNEEPVIFDTSIVPWWSWVKRFHLPEAELLNGRAAMVGFFMAYFVDSLTGVGLVDQMGNFFCKTLLFVAVGGVLLIRKNEDIEKVKKLLEETTFYDKQWQATWKEEAPPTTPAAKN
ncbi:hypothetical protein MIMGU_mgv1a012232mg [Erythranthe guttata]|uniref:Lil3 protein n=1 Tax=Erythranthe guttata TaxID=4155 RepID=A0A022QYS9_ERYGU|nr:PREDICTED: uncharacterized protein LOC105964234 [Erythranthe guttata]EYU31720.1 hypothetical protein MIMGU_mgv1a012232mg [Erythranthe guttata]|eukprot:XP_012844211.1 PREDICTED: uncharacterized protein LOC105964234 [Erythranthe guttata]